MFRKIYNVNRYDYSRYMTIDYEYICQRERLHIVFGVR